SPRMWRPTRYKPDDIDEFRERMAGGPIRSVVIHAVYLINVASDRPDVRENSLASLKHALQVGDAIGADGVVFHPGSRKAGELETRGLSAFLSEPRFEDLPALLEVNGPGGHGPDAEQVAIAKKLRARGLAARKRSKNGSPKKRRSQKPRRKR